MIDTHCHIDEPQYAVDLPAFLARQKAGGVERILVPGVDVPSIKTVGEVCDRFPDYLLPALGLHPENITPDYREQLAAIEAELFAPHRRYIAVGEIGLDYHFGSCFRVVQQRVLHTQLEWAEQLSLPVMIHCRDAVEDCLAVLRQHPHVQGVFHCFSGSREVAEQILEMGYCLGIGGVLTFKNCRLADTLAHLPVQRLVLETDAPYMSPVPHRGEPNESRWMSFVADRLADIYLLSPADIDRLTTATARTLFHI